MLFKKKEKKTFDLKVKEKGFEELSFSLPKQLPQPNRGYRYITNSCDGLVFSWIVKPEQAMNYDSIEDTIKLLRENLDENSGIIECKNGFTKNGNKFIYSIRKIRFYKKDQPWPIVTYQLNCNVKIKDVDYFVDANFAEVATTGLRDSIGFNIYQNLMEKKYPDKELEFEQIVESYVSDPYDENYKQGFLMNFSENEMLDEKFPDHPLSELRKYVRWLIENN